MPLHSTNPKAHRPTDDVETDAPITYASELSQHSLPRRRLAEHGVPPAVAYALVRDELLLDGNSRQNLATFCTTRVSPEVEQLMSDCVDKNMIDKDEYPQTAEIESRAVHMLADLWHSPSAATTIGCSTTGSSEAAMLGGLALKWNWRKRRQAAGKSIDRPNLVCGPVQVCWHKFARYFDVELRQVPIRPDGVSMHADDVVTHCDENTIGVVPTLGVTFTCVYEPVKKIAAALDALQKLRTRHPDPRRRRQRRVHRAVRSAGPGVGFPHPARQVDQHLRPQVRARAARRRLGRLARHAATAGGAHLPRRLSRRRHADVRAQLQPAGRADHRAVLQLHSLRPRGLPRRSAGCVDTAHFLAGRRPMGPFEMLYDGTGGLPAIAYTLKDPGTAGFSLYDLSDRVRMRGWQIASYPLPANRQDTVVQRILVRQGVSRDMASLLADDMRRALEHFKAHPTPASGEDRRGFHH